MKYYRPFILYIGIIFMSAQCTNNHSNPPQLTPDDPKLSSIIKRGHNSLIDELWADTLSKGPLLSALSEQLQALNQATTDSISYLEDFINQNHQYYKEAYLLSKTLEDSLLKKELELILDKHKRRFEENVSSLKTVLAASKNKQVNLNDYYTLLKITSTLPQVKKFQEHQPSLAGIRLLQQQQDSLLRVMKPLLFPSTQ